MKEEEVKEGGRKKKRKRLTCLASPKSNRKAQVQKCTFNETIAKL